MKQITITFELVFSQFLFGITYFKALKELDLDFAFLHIEIQF